MAQECRRLRSGDGRREKRVVPTGAKLRQSKGDA